MSLKRIFTLVLLLSLASNSYSNQSPNQPQDQSQSLADQSQLRHWQPPIILAGNGDPKQAIVNLNKLVDLQKVVTRNSKFDEQTQQFIDDLWSSFERFKLKKFYKLLPEENQDWRQIHIYGARHDNVYLLGADKSIIGTPSELNEFGDLRVGVKAKKLPKKSRHNTIYHLDAELDAAVGMIDFEGPRKALGDVLAQLGTIDRDFHASDYRERTKQANPLLEQEDVDVIAPLWAAYPSTGELLAQMGQIEELIVKDHEGPHHLPYREVHLSLLLEPERFREFHPNIAKRSEKLGKILKFTLEIFDEDGRLAQIKLDSDALRLEFHLLVNELGIVPVKDGKALVSKVHTLNEPNFGLTANIDAQIELLGMIYHVDNIGADVKYQQISKKSKLTVNVTGIPEIAVGGAALGFLPTPVLDFFLPTNVDELIYEFFRVACKGNDGEGIVFTADLEEKPELNTSNLNLHLSSETKSNFFVSLAMGIINQRIIPDSATTEDIKNFADRLQVAFRKDINNFTGLVARIEEENARLLSEATAKTR